MTKRMLLTFLLLSSLGMILALEELSLESAKDELLQENLDYLSVQAKQEQSEYAKKSAFFSYFPSASLSGSHSRQEPESVISGGYTNQVGLSLNQPLLANGSIYFTNKIQAENSLMSGVALQQKRVELLTQIEILYYNTLESKKNLTIANSSLIRSEKAYETSKIKFQQAIISKDQLLRLQVDVTNKSIVLLNARNSYSDAYRALKNYLNRDTDFELVEVDFVANPSFVEEYRKLGANFSLSPAINSHKDNPTYQNLLGKLVNSAREHNSQLALAESSIKLASYSVKQQQASFLPTLNLSLSQNWLATEKSSDFTDQTTASLNASLAIFPLANKYYNVSAQKMNLKAVNYDFQSLLSGIESSLETALNSYLISLERIQLSKLTMELNEEIFKQKTSNFQTNLISVDEYLDAQVELDQAREQYNSSLYGFLKTESALRRAIGLENSSELSNLITLALEEK